MPSFKMIDDVTSTSNNPVIKVIGLGGGGSNAVTHMIDAGLNAGVDFIAANTDAQALHQCRAATCLQMGESMTRGLGAGANPEIGRQAALESEDKIRELLDGTDMLFITAGMGGGTGTGSAPVVAKLAREMEILTVAVVTKPFSFEGKKRAQAAQHGLEELNEHVNSLITIPNERLLTVLGKNASMAEAFAAANNVLLNAVQGITEVITRPGIINVDFADVRTVMSMSGIAMMGTGTASGEDRAAKATRSAVESPLLDNAELSGASGLLVNVTTQSGGALTMAEFSEIGHLVEELAANDAYIISGAAVDPDMPPEEIRVTVVATGLTQQRPQQQIYSGANRASGQRTQVSRERERERDREPLESYRPPSRSSSGDQEQLFEELINIPSILRNKSD